MITNDVIESYLNCHYKSYLKYIGREGEKSDFEKFHDELKIQLVAKYSQKIINNGSRYAIPTSTISSEILSKGYDFILKSTFLTEDVQVNLDLLEKISNTPDPKSFSYIPVLIFANGNVTKLERLIVTCIGITLRHIHGIEPEFGKIVYGKDLKYTKVIYSNYIEEAQGILEKIRLESAPKLHLNKHCPICEFKKLCRDEATERDHLSLLGGITPKEVKKFNNRGIFTVNQLSYTFRPRRKRKKPGTYKKPHSFELQALAIREQKIHVYETPKLPKSNVEIYFDLESLPDYSFHYLIGLVIQNGNEISDHYFWANSEDEEEIIFEKFLTFISQYSEFILFHYGNYEVRYLKRMRQKLDDRAQHQVDKILKSSCNVLSFLYSHIYLPTYTNNLKEVANLIGFKWSDENASGLQSIVWRKKWESTQNEEFKNKLILYNREDCYALLEVKNLVDSIIKNESNTLGSSKIPEAVYQEELTLNPTFSFLNKNFALPEMELINDCSYFDYQKERVHVRTNGNSKKIRAKKRKKKQKKQRVNKTIIITPNKCAECGSNNIEKLRKTLSKKIVDLKFSNSGVKRWIVQYETSKYYCNDCHKIFIPEEYVKLRKFIGHNVKIWTIFQHFVNRESFQQIEFNLSELFGINVTATAAHSFKKYVSEYYEPTYNQLLMKIIESDVIYVDETPFNMLHETAYAWVFTNCEEVISIYKPTREGDFLKDLLKNFKGILVSDFFPAYDTIDCPQQKCLIHLLRDFNNDLLKNPFDEEFKEMTRMFTKLLQNIVETIDKYGLKKRHLNKHKKEADTFLKKVLKKNYKSEVAQQYQKRLEKNKNSLFRFLNYDNVSWNNIYAEHAIKILATHRNKNIKYFRESRLDEYLRIMSIYQTCEYKEISFLEFLLSKETDIDNFV